METIKSFLAPVATFLKRDWWLAPLISVVLVVVSFVLIDLVLMTMPPDYYRVGFSADSSKHWAHALALAIIKNIIGWVLILAGIAMLFLPGQGLLTIILGLVLINFPGKRALELKLTRHQKIRDGLNWLRRKSKREPFVFD